MLIRFFHRIEEHSSLNLFLMHANLFCNKYRSLVAFAATAILCQFANAQKMYYSQTERNLPSETKTYIIGNVDDNTIIWKYIPQSYNSQILVYDNSMRLLQRVNANVFANNNVSCLQFINRRHSFDVIAQVCTKHSFYCQLASFNSAGTLLHSVKTLSCKALVKNKYNGSYDIAVSANKKYFLIAKNHIQASDEKVELEYNLYYMSDSLQSITAKTISIPYYKDMNTAFTPTQVSNTGDIMFAEYLSQDRDTNSHIIVYKAAAGSNDYTACTADIVNKQLKDINLKLDNLNNNYIVFAAWASKKSAASPTNCQKESGAFNWVINENMESVKNDTTYILPGVSPAQMQAFNSNNITAKDAVALMDGTCMLALTGTTGRVKNMYSDDDNDVISGYYTNAEPTGLVIAANPQADQPVAPTGKSNISNGYYNTDYAYAPSEYYYAPNPASKKKNKQPAFNANLVLMRINNTGNDMMWTRNITSDHDQNAFSFVNNYALLNSGNALYFICKKFLAKDKESFENIKVTADGSISVSQIMYRNTDYEILVDRGVQVSNNEIIFPCIYQDKTLAFAKFEIE